MAAATAAFLMGVCGMLQAAPVAEVISYDQSGLKASDARIHEAIKQAAQMRKWGIVSDKPGKVLLVYPINNRSLHYQATVSVTYGKVPTKLNTSRAAVWMKSAMVATARKAWCVCTATSIAGLPILARISIAS